MDASLLLRDSDTALNGGSLTSQRHMRWTEIESINQDGGRFPRRLRYLVFSLSVPWTRLSTGRKIQLQDDAAFIIASHYTDTTAAELLGASADTATVTRAIKLVNGDVSKSKTRVEVLEAQADDIATRLTHLEEVVHSLSVIQSDVDERESIRNKVLGRQTQINNLLFRYRYYWVQWKTADPLIKLPIPSPPNDSRFEILTDLHNRYMEILRVIECAKHSHKGVPPVPSIRDRFSLLRDLYLRGVYISARIRILVPVAGLAPKPRPDFGKYFQRIESLRNLKERFLRTQQDLDTLTHEKEQVARRLRELDKEYRGTKKLIDSLEMCPFCSAPIHDGKYCEAGVA
jgi:chaperonin cofactor prefoldin